MRNVGLLSSVYLWGGDRHPDHRLVLAGGESVPAHKDVYARSDPAPMPGVPKRAIIAAGLTMSFSRAVRTLKERWRTPSMQCPSRQLSVYSHEWRPPKLATGKP